MIANFIRHNLSISDKVVNIGARVGYLEERFIDTCREGRWIAYDVSPQSCKLSNGLVQQKEILNLARESLQGSFLVMIGCSMYFRSGHVYEACEKFEKILIVDIAMQKYSLSISTLDKDHYSYSFSDFVYATKNCNKSIALYHFGMVQNRLTIYISMNNNF
jgi:hypothetical protein